MGGKYTWDAIKHIGTSAIYFSVSHHLFSPIGCLLISQVFWKCLPFECCGFAGSLSLVASYLTIVSLSVNFAGQGVRWLGVELLHRARCDGE